MNQLNLFGAQDITPIEPHEPNEATKSLARKLPEQLYLGTSSWSFPGWRGIVYKDARDRKNYQTLLARHGLAAYGKHPLFRAVDCSRVPAPSLEFRRSV